LLFPCFRRRWRCSFGCADVYTGALSAVLPARY
jgi:hypothetical protein